MVHWDHCVNSARNFIWGFLRQELTLSMVKVNCRMDLYSFELLVSGIRAVISDCIFHAHYFESAGANGQQIATLIKYFKPKC